MAGNVFTRARDAVRGLPHLYIMVYLEFFLAADWTTGIAGQKSRLSMRALRERLEVEPAPGRSAAGQPTDDELKRAINYLVAKGHMVRIGRAPFVFKLPAILGPQSVQNKLAPEHTQQSAQQSAQPVCADSSIFPDAARAGITTISPATDQLNNQLNNPTSDLDNLLTRDGVIHRAATTPTEFAEYFISKGFQPHQACTPRDVETYKRWIAAGATIDTVRTVVDKVTQRLSGRGVVQIASPRYYDKEIHQALKGTHGTHSQQAAESGNDGYAAINRLGK